MLQQLSLQSDAGYKNYDSAGMRCETLFRYTQSAAVAAAVVALKALKLVVGGGRRRLVAVVVELLGGMLGGEVTEADCIHVRNVSSFVFGAKLF